MDAVGVIAAPSRIDSVVVAGDLDDCRDVIGKSAASSIGERVVVAGAGGRPHSVAARIVAKQEFAGYWEYMLDEAIFTHPAHPNWGGTGLLSEIGRAHV